MEQGGLFCLTDNSNLESQESRQMCKGEDTTGPGPQHTTQGAPHTSFAI